MKENQITKVLKTTVTIKVYLKYPILIIFQILLETFVILDLIFRQL